MACRSGRIPPDRVAWRVQKVQNGMSLLARDGASRAELETVAEVAMLGWDARTDGRRETETKI